MKAIFTSLERIECVSNVVQPEIKWLLQPQMLKQGRLFTNLSLVISNFDIADKTILISAALLKLGNGSLRLNKEPHFSVLGKTNLHTSRVNEVLGHDLLLLDEEALGRGENGHLSPLQKTAPLVS